MLDVHDTKGISMRKLEHIFLGEVISSPGRVMVKGYHCYDRVHGDERVRAINISYQNPCQVRSLNSYSRITLNRDQGLFEADVEDIITGTRKGVRSTFFNPSWNRQKIVDCIDSLSCLTPTDVASNNLAGNRRLPVLKIDINSGLIVVDANITTYPILRL